jgi:hypothetical protein
MRAISAVGASSPILLFFLGGGVALHERLVGIANVAEVYAKESASLPCCAEPGEGSCTVE